MDEKERREELQVFDNVEDTGESEEIEAMEDTEEIGSNLKREGRKNKKLPEKYADFEMYMAFDAVSYVEDVPDSYEDLKGREDEIFWKDVMQKEIKSIDKNKTWIEVEMPNNSEILNTKWIFSFKPLEDTIENKYKTRLVVRGFAQYKNL